MFFKKNLYAVLALKLKTFIVKVIMQIWKYVDGGVIYFSHNFE